MWALVAAGNASVLITVLRGGRSSPIPFIGGAFAVLSFAVCPLELSLKLPLLLAALVIDFGSLPLIAMLAWAAVADADTRAAAARRVARVPRGKLLGIAFLAWLLLSGVTLHVAARLAMNDAATWLVVSAVFWMAFAGVMFWARRQKHSTPPEA